MFLETQHHVAIIASSCEKTTEFYIEKLGFRVIRQVYRPEQQDHLWILQLGNTCLEIFIRPNAPARVTNPEALGLRHLAFRVDDIQRAVHWLNEKGITTEPIREDTINGGRFTFFMDPDGLPLELHE